MEKKQIQIYLSAPEEILTLRARVLRPGQELKASCYEGDHARESFHLGAWHNERLVACATWVSEKAEFSSAGRPYRLRGMAVDPTFRGQGVGKKMMDHSLIHLREKSCDLAWCKAREVAFLFYQKMGFEFHGEMFELPMIGPHKFMFRHLT
jgi:predicted GNAT family N-acyltransferase